MRRKKKPSLFSSSQTLSRNEAPLFLPSANAGTRLRMRSRRSRAGQSVASARSRRKRVHNYQQRREHESSSAVVVVVVVSFGLRLASDFSSPFPSGARFLSLSLSPHGPARRAWRGRRPPPGRPWFVLKEGFFWGGVKKKKEKGGEEKKKE